MVGVGMAERRKSEGRSSSSGSKDETPTRGTAPSAGGHRRAREVRALRGGEAAQAVGRRRDGPGQAPAGRRPLLRALGAEPDHVLRRRRGRGGRHRRRLAGAGRALRQAAHSFQGQRPLVDEPRPTPSLAAEQNATPVDPGRSLRRARQPYPVPRRAPAHRPRRRTPSRATHQTSRSADRGAARSAQPGSARSSVSRVTGIRHLSPASSTIRAPADEDRPSTEPAAS